MLIKNAILILITVYAYIKWAEKNESENQIRFALQTKKKDLWFSEL